MKVITIEQLTALGLLIDFLFGVTFGVIGGAIHGSRRGALLAPAADTHLSAGARVLYGVFIRDDDGYLQSLLPVNDQTSGDQRGGDRSDSRRQELDR